MKGVRDTLAQEAAEAEAHREEAPIGMQRASGAGRAVSHVYTVRMPSTDWRSSGPLQRKPASSLQR